MAQRRVITEGFELYNGVAAGAGLGLASAWSIGAVTELRAGRFGGTAVSVQAFIRRAITQTSSLVSGVALNMHSRYQSISFLSMQRDEEFQLQLRQNVDGSLSVVRGSAVLATSDIDMLPERQWAYIEWCVTISDTTGYSRVYLNGVEVESLRLDNADTQNLNTSAVNFVRLGSNSGGSVWFDDVYVEVDGMTPIGEGRIWASPVVSDVSTDFTPLTGGDNYAMVDEIPASAADYNYSDVLGAKDMFNVMDLDFTPSTIYGVQLTVNATKDEAGVRAVKSVLSSGGTEVQGSQFVLALSANNWHNDFWPLNPDTGAQWQVSEFDAINIGYEITL